jgi:hypothetical protein
MKSNLIFSPPAVFVETNGEQRLIGEIHFETLIVIRDPEKHLMKKWNAYGFNCELIDSGKVKVVIVRQPDSSQLIITVDNLLSFGRIHQEEGWDKQYFVELKDFDKI